MKAKLKITEKIRALHFEQEGYYANDNTIREWFEAKVNFMGRK